MKIERPAHEWFLASSLIRLSVDGVHDDNPVANLIGYVNEGPHKERMLAIEALGILQVDEALPLLAEQLDQCSRSLQDPSIPFEISGSEGYQLWMASEICKSLARLDRRESHEVLVTTATKRGDRYVRANAIEAMAFESNYHSPRVIRSFLSHRDWVLRRGAVDAMFECSGFRLRAYKKDLVEQLKDRSPDVVIHVIDALVLLTHRDPEIWDILEPLLEDHRACKATMRSGSMIKISEYVAPYFE